MVCVYAYLTEVRSSTTDMVLAKRKQSTNTEFSLKQQYLVGSAKDDDFGTHLQNNS